MENKRSCNVNDILAKGKCINNFFFKSYRKRLEQRDSPLDTDIDDMELRDNEGHGGAAGGWMRCLTGRND